MAASAGRVGDGPGVLRARKLRARATFRGLLPVSEWSRPTGTARATLALKQGQDCLLQIANNGDGPSEDMVSARAVAAAIMGVSSAYVGRAQEVCLAGAAGGLGCNHCLVIQIGDDHAIWPSVCWIRT